MTNFEYVQKSIDLFEDSLGSDSPLLTLESLAGRIGYSARHLGRLFQSLCGESLGRYMLRRRLSEAAVLIRGGSDSAAGVSRRLGWEDYSAFSRAFRKEFGMSPGCVKTGEADTLSLASRARPMIPDGLYRETLDPLLVRMPELHVTGMVFYMGPNEKTFHRPWQVFVRHERAVRGRIGSCSYQFSSWTEESGRDEGLWIHCAVETGKAAHQEPVFFSRTVPETLILRFVHTGPVEYLYETYRRIWQLYLPRSTFRLKGSWEFQRYPDPADPSRIEICLPVDDVP